MACLNIQINVLWIFLGGKCVSEKGKIILEILQTFLIPIYGFNIFTSKQDAKYEIIEKIDFDCAWHYKGGRF